MKSWTKEQALYHIASRTVETEDGCHEWQGPKTADGYGQVGASGLYETFFIKGVHRLIVHLMTGHEFSGRHEHVMHSCHNRSCCNPEHLSVGSAAENARDRVLRSRQLGISSGACGERHPFAILTDDQVRAIKRLLMDGIKGVDIAKKFGVSVNTVSRIKLGRNWTHVAV